MGKRLILFVVLAVSINSFVLAQSAPTAPSEIKGFNLSPDNIGAAANSVNLYTGDLYLPVNLVTLPNRNGLDVNVSISYNSNVQNQVDTWNLDAPGGILGLGWSIDLPRIVADTKQTGTREDDVYYLLEGGSSNRLIRTTSGSDANGGYFIYETKGYQFWKIKFYYDSYELTALYSGGANSNKWEITKENGFKYIYGDKNSSRSTLQYIVRWENWIGNSSQTIGQSQLASAWNLSEIINLQGEKVLFEYDNEEQYVGNANGKKHTEASYLKRITDPIGRKIQFVYFSKSSFNYMEPHTEQAEPDAYQEVYEKKYLDHIDVILETGIKQLSVNFLYDAINAGTNTAKMLLSKIEQRNANNNALPGASFGYYQTTDSNGYKGFLQRVTYPTGGTASYTYQMSGNSLGHSEQKFTLNAPTGYSEPKIWIGSDYVLLTWREINPDGSHNTSPKNVKAFVYQWVGEWKGKFIADIPNVSASYYANASSEAFDYIDFQVEIQERFFAILSHPSANLYKLSTFFKKEDFRGDWAESFVATGTNDYGNYLPTFFSGENFLGVGSHLDESAFYSRLYTFQGNEFAERIVDQSSGSHCYTSGNNYFISHNRDVPKIEFSYLTEEKKWLTVPISNSLLFTSSQLSYWHGSNSYAVAMAANNPEFIYRWDRNFSSFYRDDNVLGTWGDQSLVYNINNSMIAIAETSSIFYIGRVVRFNGNSWDKSPDYSGYGTTLSTSFGNDYYIFSPDLRNRPVGNYRRIYDPNLLSWTQSDLSTPEPVGGVSAGTNLQCFLGKTYFKGPSGVWNPIQSSYGNIISDKFYISGYYLYFIKNGSMSGTSESLTSTSLLTYKDNLTSPNIICTYSNEGSTVYRPNGGGFSFAFCNARAVNFHRVMFEKISGKQLDYPVSLITTNDGFRGSYTKFEYNFATATVDPSGSIAQYREVTVIPGSNNISSKPFGSTKTFFCNGLNSIDDPTITNNANLLLSGQPFEVRTLDINNITVSTIINSFYSYQKDFLNSDGVKVDVGYYFRPFSRVTTVDNITSTTLYTYNSPLGQLGGQIQTELVSYPYPNGIFLKKEYVYWWEKYDPTNTKNILTPIIQTTQSRSDDFGFNTVYLNSSVRRCKNWNANLIASTFSGEADNYVWKGTGAAPNTFSTWDASISPSADWQYAGKIVNRDDNTGQPLETSARGNINSAIIYDQTQLRVMAQASNATYSQIGYIGFEDGSKGNWTWSDGVVTTGTAKIGNNSISIGQTGITKSNLSTNQRYTISYWMKKNVANSGSVIIDGVGNVGWDDISTTWNYYEYTVTGLSSLTIKNSSTAVVYIDELRIHPQNARMTSYSYHPLFGVMSTTDANNLTIHTEYDEFGRQKNILDSERNIVKSNQYNFIK